MEVRKIAKTKRIMKEKEEDRFPWYYPKKVYIKRVIKQLKRFREDDYEQISNHSTVKIYAWKDSLQDKEESLNSMWTMDSLKSILLSNRKKEIIDEDNDSVSSDTDSDSGYEIALEAN